jgi:hypothetical protein
MTHMFLMKFVLTTVAQLAVPGNALALATVPEPLTAAAPVAVAMPKPPAAVQVTLRAVPVTLRAVPVTLPVSSIATASLVPVAVVVTLPKAPGK